jgi:hypothetical protein
MGPEDLPHGVAEPGASASSPASKVARVLVEKSGEDRLCHVITDYKIAICRPEIPAKSRSALPERSICVGQLGLAAEQSREPDRTAIESILGGYLEFLAACQGLVILQAWRGPVVGNDAEDPLALRWRRSWFSPV